MKYKRLSPVFIELDEVDSTNRFALELLASQKPMNGTVISAVAQSRGRGQRGNSWESEPGLNLTVSVIVYPSVSTDRLFYLNQVVSLAVYDLVGSFTHENLKIKWPNDILLHGKKIAGILIENQLRGSQVMASVLGIGLNVNQPFFSPELRATSLYCETQNLFSLNELKIQLIQHLDFWLDRLSCERYDDIHETYHQRLFGRNQERKFKAAENTLEGIIQGVSSDGKLIIRVDQQDQSFAFKEVIFLYD